MASTEATVAAAAKATTARTQTTATVTVPATAVVPFTATDAAINTTKALTAGALAGAISRTVTSPLERLKVMKQVQSASTKYDGLFSALARMYREEGLRGYWKGNGTNVARIAPFSAIQFFTFDLYKGFIVGDDAHPGPVKTFLAGAATGMTASTICYPLDLVRSVLSVQTTETHYNGIAHAMKTIVKQDGFFGLYRGIGPTLMGIAPYVAINMSVFDILKRRYQPDREAKYFTLINLGLGATSGFVSAAITYPTDLIRRRMQLQGMKGGHDLPPYRNTLHCVTEIIRTEGVKSLYKGMVPCFLKVVPSMAIAFSTYEALRTVWGFDPSRLSKPPSAG